MAYTEKRGSGPYPWSVKHKVPGGGEKRVSGFAEEDAAMNYGLEQEADLRRGRYHDPSRGQILMDDYFWKKWLPVQDISDKSRRNHEGEYRTHIAPRWGKRPLNDLDLFEIAALEIHLKAIRSASTRRNVMDLLRFMVDDAVRAGLLQFSPMLPRQRGRGQREPEHTREGMLTSIDEILAICDRLKPSDALMTLTTLFTGMRWGEVSGMRRSFFDLHPAADGQLAYGHYVIDPLIGAVHEEHSGRRFFAWPKGHKGRTVQLPPFLVEQVAAYVASMPEGRDLLFVNGRNVAHNHSSFGNNHWRPACDGRPGRPVVRGHSALEQWEPVRDGLWFHDMRHTHKTWLAEDGIEPVARDERLGHTTQGMDGVYVHVTPAMRARVLQSLEARWSARHGRSTPNWLPLSGG